MADASLKFIISARDSATKTLGIVGGRLQSLSKRVISLRGAFASLAGSGGVGLLVKSSLDASDALVKTASKLGIGVEALAEYRYASERAGVAQNTFDMALQRLTRRAAEAAQGTGEAKDVLAQMNIQLRDSEGNLRPVEDLLVDIAEDFRKTKDAGERLRKAFKLFDSEGAVLVNVLGQGGEALMAMREEARRLGAGLTELQSRNVEAAQDAFSRFGFLLGNLKAKVSSEIAPGLANAFNSMTLKIVTAIEASYGSIDNFAASVAQSVTEFFSGVGKVVNSVTATLTAFGSVLSGVSGTLSGIPSTASAAGQAIAAVVTVALVARVNSFLAALVGVKLTLDALRNARISDLLDNPIEENVASLIRLRRELEALEETGAQGSSLVMGRILNLRSEINELGDAINLQFEQIQKSTKAGAEAAGLFGDAFTEAFGKVSAETEALLDRLNALSEGEAKAGTTAATRAAKDLSETFTSEGDRAAKATQEATQRMTDFFTQLASSGKASFKDLINSILADLIRLNTSKIFNQLFEAIFSVIFTKPGSGAVGKPAVGHFQHGGQGEFGGHAGTDSNLLSLNGQPFARVSRGEVFTVHPKGSRGPGAGSPAIVVNQTNNFASGIDRAQMMKYVPLIRDAAIAGVAERVGRSRGYAKALQDR